MTVKKIPLWKKPLFWIGLITASTGVATAIHADAHTKLSHHISSTVQPFRELEKYPGIKYMINGGLRKLHAHDTHTLLFDAEEVFRILMKIEKSPNEPLYTSDVSIFHNKRKDILLQLKRITDDELKAYLKKYVEESTFIILSHEETHGTK